ncbi:MAG: ATP-binding protein, partial [Thermomicrobiales bacterium]
MAVATICARLDGLPLAIELAAARIKVLPPVEMAERLRRPLHVLMTGGARDLPARQRTLRETLDWSHDLPSPSERRQFRRLAVFRGGWSLEVAESVAGSERSEIGEDGSSAGSVLDAMAALVGSSLVRVTEGAGGAPRFSMLETVGEYARERLAEGGDERPCRSRHAHVFLALAERLDADLRGSGHLAARDRLTADIDNLRAAVDWAIGSGETELALRLTAALYWPWLQLGLFREGLRCSAAALALPGGPGRSVMRARALLAAGSFAWHQGDPDTARGQLDESAALSSELEDRQGQGLAALCLGLLALSRGEQAVAQSRLLESVAHFRAVGDGWHLANALFILGNAAVKNDPETARTLYEESLSRFRGLGDPWGIAWPLTGLGGIALQRGEWSTARTLFMEGLALRRELRDPWGMAISLTSLGDAARRAGDRDEAETFLVEGLSLLRELGDQERVAWALHTLGCVAADRGDGRRAYACFIESLALRQAQGHRPGMASSLVGLARIAAADAPERAARLLGPADAARDGGRFDAGADERIAEERLLATVRGVLGQKAFAAAWDAGRAWP